MYVRFNYENVFLWNTKNDLFTNTRMSYFQKKKQIAYKYENFAVSKYKKKYIVFKYEKRTVFKYEK